MLNIDEMAKLLPRKERFSSVTGEIYKRTLLSSCTEGSSFYVESSSVNSCPSNNLTELKDEKNPQNVPLVCPDSQKLVGFNWQQEVRHHQVSHFLHEREEVGLNRLQHELFNLKHRLFDTLQEYEDIKDSFTQKHFPQDWEPPILKNLRDKVARLETRIDKERNKLNKKVDEKNEKKNYFGGEKMVIDSF